MRGLCTGTVEIQTGTSEERARAGAKEGAMHKNARLQRLQQTDACTTLSRLHRPQSHQSAVHPQTLSAAARPASLSLAQWLQNGLTCGACLLNGGLKAFWILDSFVRVGEGKSFVVFVVRDILDGGEHREEGGACIDSSQPSVEGGRRRGQKEGVLSPPEAQEDGGDVAGKKRTTACSATAVAAEAEVVEAAPAEEAAHAEALAPAPAGVAAAAAAEAAACWDFAVTHAATLAVLLPAAATETAAEAGVPHIDAGGGMSRLRSFAVSLVLLPY
ncbi:hypothetical protein cyc_00195 [Cyclospora cayetanensis]|uniref:Uncharacterized protein n=1 Tax=Cyclospora cayetanensis TaxID=88456 RepID=A0A1D3D679_9EIME|nr:hypothetical protein cyc_00195 [Cyclospora cayetanensis]